jgi:hypothetical protein
MLRTTSSIVSVLVVFLAATCALPAGAVVVTGGFSGQIFLGSDFGSGPGGFFGAGSDLDNQPIIGTFRYDTAQVPPPSSTGPNFAIYSDPTFSTHFLDFSISINGRSYMFGAFPALPGIQSIEVIDNTDQLIFDYQRFGIGASESLALRFISDIDFLTGTGAPTQFDFTASGVGLTPGGSFSFDLANGDFASGSFSIESGFARAQVPEPATLSTVALALLGVAALRRGSARPTPRSE